VEFEESRKGVFGSRCFDYLVRMAGVVEEGRTRNSGYVRWSYTGIGISSWLMMLMTSLRVLASAA
jgi:hypothetical protein